MKLTYPIILEPYGEDGGGYVTTVPDMPGLVTYGASLSEAMEMVQVPHADGYSPNWRTEGLLHEPLR